MKYLMILMSGLLICVVQSAPARAHDLGYGGYLEQLNSINTFQPARSPYNERSEEVLSDRVLDRKNRVIGEVRDVMLNDQGGIVMLDVDLNRLHVGRGRLSVDYQALRVKPAGNGYILGYSDDQIEELLPTLLANMSTAAGSDGEIVMSTQAILGQNITSESGRILGKVEDVIFSELGERANFLHIRMRGYPARRAMVSIPFNYANYRMQGRSIGVSVPDDLANAMNDYLKK